MGTRRDGVDEVVELGSITLPEGVLVIGDMGYFDLWSGEDPPDLDHIDPQDDRLRAFIETAVDLEVVGPDAVAAAAAFDRQQGTHLYDIPGHGIEQSRASFAGICGPLGLHAELVQVAPVPHAVRARRCAERGGGEFIIFGIPVCVVGDLPKGVPLRVEATRADFGEVGSHWRTLRVVAGRRSPVASRSIGVVGVDWARIGLMSPSALGAWEHVLPRDGLADVAFWGASADEVAARTGAGRIEGDVRGWADLPFQDALARGEEIERISTEPSVRIATDFRPHSDHWNVMRQIRSSPHEVGSLTLGDSTVMGLMTSWGDGLFPVSVETDRNGKTVGVTVTLGDAERAERVAALYRRARS